MMIVEEDKEMTMISLERNIDKVANTSSSIEAAKQVEEDKIIGEHQGVDTVFDEREGRNSMRTISRIMTKNILKKLKNLKVPEELSSALDVAETSSPRALD